MSVTSQSYQFPKILFPSLSFDVCIICGRFVVMKIWSNKIGAFFLNQPEYIYQRFGPIFVICSAICEYSRVFNIKFLISINRVFFMLVGIVCNRYDVF